MPSGEVSLPQRKTQDLEQGAAFALFPLISTLVYYALPDSLQSSTLAQFAPQIMAYLGLTFWAARNDAIPAKLGLKGQKLLPGMKIGLATGIILGCANTLMILQLVPALGYDIAFLKETPHAQIPQWIMVPWFICGIALFVELNFRGFLLGRLAALESSLWRSSFGRRWSPLAVLSSALVFAFDPFMTATFQHLHWIAVWDGIVWAVIWVRSHNLYATMIAHAIEVIVMYSAVRAALGP